MSDAENQLAAITVQLICSGTGGEKDLKMYHLYNTCLTPYALGIPSDQVQHYCCSSFLPQLEGEEDAIRTKVAGGLTIVGTGANQPVLPLSDEIFAYFMRVFRRARPFEVNQEPLPRCSIRIFVGHGSLDEGQPFASCNEAIPYRTLVQPEEAERNAEVLTTVDCCLTPKIVRALQDPNYVPPDREPKNFNNITFPVACSHARAMTTHSFRVSWAGHHEVTAENPRFAPEGYPYMSEPVGFPAMNSLMAAVKIRYIDTAQEDRDTDLGDIYVETFRSIQRRYELGANQNRMEMLPVPHHHSLGILQGLLDDRILQPRADAFNCLLYNRHQEWFTTTELQVSLPPRGEKAVRLAREIAEFVRRQVKAWYSDNQKLSIRFCSNDSVMAWKRLCHSMGPFWNALNGITLKIHRGTICTFDQEDDLDGNTLKDWAVGCDNLPDIVDIVVSYLEHNKGETLADFALEHNKGKTFADFARG